MESAVRDVRGLMPRTDERDGERQLSAGEPWGPHPAVLHLDIDAFFASVEQLRNPALHGRPVVVGSGVVASASYEARACGIRAGTPLYEVPRLCPAAVVLPGHAPTYRAFAERIFALAAALSPNLETYLDDALIDLSGTERVHGHLIRAAARLRRHIQETTGLSVALGLGTNRMVARMATRLAKPGGFVWLRPGGEAAFVARRPIEELPGIGHKRSRLLREMGVTRIGELRRFSANDLRDLFGAVGLLLAARARGEETAAVSRRELPRSIRRETSFDAPQTEDAALEGMLHYLADRAAAQARRLGAAPRQLRVHLRWADGSAAARSLPLGGGRCVSAPLCENAVELLRALRTRRLGLRNLGVELSGLTTVAGSQLRLFEAAPVAPHERRAAARAAAAAGLDADAGAQVGAAQAACISRTEREVALDGVVDRLREQFGFRALVRGRAVELLGTLPSDGYGFVLRTPCLTR
jgi:DNA polymerase IV